MVPSLALHLADFLDDVSDSLEVAAVTVRRPVHNVELCDLLGFPRLRGMEGGGGGGRGREKGRGRGGEGRGRGRGRGGGGRGEGKRGVNQAILQLLTSACIVSHAEGLA